MTKSIKSIFDEIDKELGSDGIFSGTDNFISDVKTSSSGSIALDEAIGPWGLPMGRLIQYAGPESSGKSLMALMAIREWQKLAPHNTAFFCDVEQTFSPDWASKLGVDLDRIKISKKTSAKEIFDDICGIPDPKNPNKPKKKRGILDMIRDAGGAEKSGLGVIVVDSLPSLLPPQEEVAAAGKVNMAPMARFLPPELRKLTPLLSESDVMFIAINQIRVKIGVLYGNPEDTPGGRAWKHACSLMVNFAAIRAKDSYLVNEYDERIGHRIRAKMQKNKVGVPWREAEFEIKYLEGVVNSHKEVAELGIKYNIIGRPSNVTYTYNGENIAKGKDNLYDVLLSNKELQQEIIQKIIKLKDDGLKLKENDVNQM